MMIPAEKVRTIRMRELTQKVNLHPSTIYALIAEGKFPPSHKLVPGGRASGWLETTIDEWLLARAGISGQEGTI
jgi:prophage regulatory protein